MIVPFVCCLRSEKPFRPLTNTNPFPLEYADYKKVFSEPNRKDFFIWEKIYL